MGKRMVERRHSSIDYDQAECEITQDDIKLVAKGYDKFFRNRQVCGSLDNRTNLPRERPPALFAPYGELGKSDDRKED